MGENPELLSLPTPGKPLREWTAQEIAPSVMIAVIQARNPGRAKLSRGGGTCAIHQVPRFIDGDDAGVSLRGYRHDIQFSYFLSANAEHGT